MTITKLSSDIVVSLFCLILILGAIVNRNAMLGGRLPGPFVSRFDRPSERQTQAPIRDEAAREALTRRLFSARSAEP